MDDGDAEPSIFLSFRTFAYLVLAAAMRLALLARRLLHLLFHLLQFQCLHPRIYFLPLSCFLEIFVRFSCPLEITSDRGTHFVNDLIDRIPYCNKVESVLS